MQILDYVKHSVFGKPQKRAGTLIRSRNQRDNVTDENALELSDILTCVRVLAESIACLPLCLYAKNNNGGIKDYNHELYELERW